MGGSPKGRVMTEKTIIEEDLKGLEMEIDAAVDRLFVEKGGGPLKDVAVSSLFTEPLLETKKEPKKEPKREIEQEAEIEIDLEMPSIAPTSSLFQPLEKLETQILSLEWEITRENLARTADEVVSVKGRLRDHPDISSVLTRMEAVLNHMVQNEEGIRPHLIQFLLDSKETVKLLMREETEDEIGIYKKLALAGMDARYSCLEEIHGARPEPSAAPTEEFRERVEPSSIGPDLPEKILRTLDSFSSRLDVMMDKMDQHLASHETSMERPGSGTPYERSLKTKVTVVKCGEKLIGVESHQVFKLFKVPSSLRDKILLLPQVRLNGLKVRMIDLENLVSVSRDDQEGEGQILILKGDGLYKGLMVDRVVNQLYGSLEQGETLNGSFLGMIHWTYENLPIRIPILDVQNV